MNKKVLLIIILAIYIPLAAILGLWGLRYCFAKMMQIGPDEEYHYEPKQPIPYSDKIMDK